MKKISVIIPVYNSERYLDKCVQSVLSQSYKNIEVILINDGSTDNSKAICKNFVEMDNRVLFINKKNGGASSARNAGIDMATGEYIGFVDSDDWIEPTMYEILKNNMETYATDISICGQWQNQKLVGKLNSAQIEVYNQAKALEIMLDATLYGWSLCNKLFQSNLVKKYKLNDRILTGEDLLFHWIAFRKIKNVCYDPRPLHHVVTRQDSLGHILDTQHLNSYMKVTRIIYKTAKQEGENEIFEKFFSGFIGTAVSVARSILIHNDRQYKRLFTVLCKYIRKNLLREIVNDSLTIRQKLGLLYFCLPSFLCWKIKSIIKKESDML